MSDSPDLSPDDVKEILRLVDESQFDEFELETPRLTIRFRRGETALPVSAAPPARPVAHGGRDGSRGGGLRARAPSRCRPARCHGPSVRIIGTLFLTADT
ncbi:MAG: hypothetical protein ACXWYO_05730 [Gaiellaceae bacterium]